MISKEKLNHEERQFFSLVREATVTNPFSGRRDELDQLLSEKPHSDNRDITIKNVISEIKRRINILDNSGRGNINCFDGTDKSLAEALFSFDFFYTYRKAFDQLIVDQINTGDKTFRLPFANEAREFQIKRGFSEDAIKLLIEESYQFRRSFYFIDRMLVGKSKTMQKLRFDIWNNIFTHNFQLYRDYLRNRMEDFSTLILGETGTGKGAVASAIGRSGYIPYDIKKNRFTESFTSSFVSINISQFPESLIESELFGHKKGAFTGAIENYDGVFSRCMPHGSILLDEIGEISPHLQIKLLQILQERIFYPVGSRKKERFSGRVIAATNRSLNELRNKGIFRDDFYYRLSSDVIMVPSLRQRICEDTGELDHLIQFIIKRMVGRDSPELVQMVRQVIDKQLGLDYPWHGNVRELEQCARRVLLKQEYMGDQKIYGYDLMSQLFSGIDNGNIPANKLLSGYCRLLHDRYATIEEVARRTKLDRRTVNKYIKEWESGDEED
ncbi:MAG: sigma 54-interacting transcriptional regulator [Proteobacteria bacterium]|nr:sigma 54-interacting transcriptional regulator [Pseudomonadota bacterium]